MSFHPSGTYSAQWVPTGPDGRVDRDALAAHIAFEQRAGIRGILALGSTGQFPFFSPGERKHLLEAIVGLASSLPVIANISDIRPDVAVELGRHARSIGVSAVALMPPPFYPMAQADILAHFLHVAERVDLPVMLYNFPELAGKRIDLPTIGAFAERAHLAAIKQSGSEFAYHRELIALGREKGFAVMSGADTRLSEVYALGADGCIGGLVNFAPEWMTAIDRVRRNREPGDATTAVAAMTEVGAIINPLSFPLNVAAGMEARGFKTGVLKSVISETTRVLLWRVVAELSALFASHQPAAYRA